MTEFQYQKLNASLPYALPEELEYVRAIIDGWEQEHIRTSSELTIDKTVVMIGAGPGVFALAALEGRTYYPHFHVIEIDTFQWFIAHCEMANIKLNRLNLHTGNSADFGKTWSQGRNIDLLIIDGDHSKEGFLADTLAWFEHIKPGGIVFAHDYLMRPGGFNGSGKWLHGPVAEVLDMWSKTSAAWRLVEQVGISAVVQLQYPKEIVARK